jgi:hypothetical protein
LCARQASIVGVEEDTETVGWPRTQVHPIRIYRLHISSLTCGNDEIIGEIGIEWRKILIVIAAQTSLRRNFFAFFLISFVTRIRDESRSLDGPAFARVPDSC